MLFPLSDIKTITARLGEKVTLPCQAPNSNNLAGVEWSRQDLEPEYVLLLRDGHIVPEDQQPSFKDRVELQDQQMKNGDVSLILSNVTINDAGKYECSVTQKKDFSPFTTTTITLDLRVINSKGEL